MAKRVKGLWCESFKYNNKWANSSTEAHSAAKPQLKSIEPRIHHRWTRMERSDFLTPPEMDRNSCFDAWFNKTFSAPLRLCAKIACFSCPFLSQHPRAVLPQRRRDAENFLVYGTIPAKRFQRRGKIRCLTGEKVTSHFPISTPFPVRNQEI